MWVFDGEEWTEEGVNRDSSSATRPNQVAPRLDEMQPELQIVEISHLPPLPRYSPMPLP